jgi:hypothetical protein
VWVKGPSLVLLVEDPSPADHDEALQDPDQDQDVYQDQDMDKESDQEEDMDKESDQDSDQERGQDIDLEGCASGSPLGPPGQGAGLGPAPPRHGPGVGVGQGHRPGYGHGRRYLRRTGQGQGLEGCVMPEDHDEALQDPDIGVSLLQDKDS